jgi:hypothetical protein
VTKVIITLVLDEKLRPVPTGIGNLPEMLEGAGIINRSVGELVVDLRTEPVE